MPTDQDELLDRLEKMLQRLEAIVEQLGEVEAHGLNEAYWQGVTDERKHRTGVDERVDDDA